MPPSNVDSSNTSPQPRTLMLATDASNSVIAEIAGGRPNPIAYSAYGERSAGQEVATRLGFNGELRESNIGWYLLGNGYRAYSPVLMRFHSPDDLSPFGKGGLNAYMYCLGDPVNFSDPTGRIRNFFNVVRRRSTSPPPRPPAARPLITTDANVYVPAPRRGSSGTHSPSAGDAMDPPPPYVESALPSYDEAAALREHASLNPSSYMQPRTVRGAIVAPSNSDQPGRVRTRPAEFTIDGIRATDPDVPPLPPTRRISQNIVRQYSMSRNPDGSWSHRSVEMVTFGNNARRGH